MAARPTKQVAVTDEVYNEWLQEVKALKPRKQKHWQDWLRNQRGEKSSVRFHVETGEFEILLSSTRGSAVHEAVSDVGASHTHVPRAGGQMSSVSAVGHAFCVSDEAGVEALRVATQANYTGNHYRNHSVKVPTAPGEPVRG